MTAPDALSIGVARPVWKCRSDMNTMPAVYGRKGAVRPGRSEARDLEGRPLRKKSNRSPMEMTWVDSSSQRNWLGHLPRRSAKGFWDGYLDLAGIAKPVQRHIGIGDGQHW